MILPGFFLMLKNSHEIFADGGSHHEPIRLSKSALAVWARTEGSFIRDLDSEDELMHAHWWSVMLGNLLESYQKFDSRSCFKAFVGGVLFWMPLPDCTHILVMASRKANEPCALSYALPWQYIPTFRLRDWQVRQILVPDQIPSFLSSALAGRYWKVSLVSKQLAMWTPLGRGSSGPTSPITAHEVWYHKLCN